MTTDSDNTTTNYLTQILGFPVNHILCISLEECVSKREKILLQATKFGLQIEFVIVKRNPVPHRGCAESHLKCIQIAKDRNLDYVCILEDDCLFLEPRMNEAMEREPTSTSLPTDWEMVYLGYNALRGYLCSPHLMNLIVSLTTHAYIVRSSIYDDILEGFRSQWWHIPEMYDIEPYDMDFLYAKDIIDVFYGKYICHRRGQSYGIYPMLATQSPDVSTISGGFIDHSIALEEHVLRVLDTPVPCYEIPFSNPHSIKDMISLSLNDSKKFILPDFVKRIKLDIGLSINAPHSHLWLQHNPNDLLVFGFEPNSDAVDQLKGLKPYENKWHFQISPDLVGTKCIVVPCALGNETRMAKLHVAEPDSGASSLYKPKTRIKKWEYVPQFCLKEFFDLFPFDQIPFIEYIKIDTQGSDLGVLLGAGTYLRDRVVYVTCNPGSSARKGSDLGATISHMASNGFKQINHPNCVDPTFVNTKFLKQAETIYICQIG